MAQESPADTPEVEPESSPDGPRLPADLRWLPIDHRTGRMIDGRGRDAQAIKRRLEGYWLALTAGGKRELTPQEVAGVRSVVALEYDLALALGAQAGGKRAGEDLTRLSSELRRSLGDLGLQAPGVASARPGDGAVRPPESAPQADPEEPRTKLGLWLSAMRHRISPILPCPEPLADRVKAQGGLTLGNMSEATREAYTAAIEAALAEVEPKPEPEAPAPAPTGQTPPEKAEIAVLKRLVEQLKGELKEARAEAQSPLVRTRKIPRPSDPQVQSYSGGVLADWARSGES